MSLRCQSATGASTRHGGVGRGSAWGRVDEKSAHDSWI